MWIGYAEEHWVELDFGKGFAGLDPEQPLALFLAGWVEYPYSQTNWAATTAGVRLEPPRLEWFNEKGQWELLLGNLGYPAGLPRMMAVELTGTLPAPMRQVGSQGTWPSRLRIRTNMEIYWDQIFAAQLQPETLVRRTTLEPAQAWLSYRGYLPEYTPDGGSPHLFDYHEKASVPLVALEGRRTPYGDVRKLVSRQDHDFALINAGDEVTLVYAADKLPALPEGWSRSFVLRSWGYCKDSDLFNPYGGKVEPIPCAAAAHGG
jgi:hypothetical protein